MAPEACLAGYNALKLLSGGACANASGVPAHCGSCCLNGQRHKKHGSQALALFDERLERFHRLLFCSDSSVQISVVGDSVSAIHDVGTARLFADALKQLVADPTRVRVKTGAIGGGQAPYLMTSCSLPPPLYSSDAILVQWSSAEGAPAPWGKAQLDESFEYLVRSFLSLPKRPLVIFISHCQAADFSAHPDFAKLQGRENLATWIPEGWFAAVRRYEAELAAHYGLPFVNSCAALRSRLRGDPHECVVGAMPGGRTRGGGRGSGGGSVGRRDNGGGRGGGSLSLDDLMRLFVPDMTHQSLAMVQLQSCLVAHAVLATTSSASALGVARAARKAEAVALPPPLGNRTSIAQTPFWKLPDTGEPDIMSGRLRAADEPVFCLSATEGQLLLGANGWRRIAGGRRGDKEWLFADVAGATITHTSPLLVTHFKLSLYTHHELGLGRLKATMLGEGDVAAAAAPSTAIDPCCPAPGCVGAPVGQGLYREFRVPHEGSLPPGRYTLRLEVVAQPEGLCAHGGSQVSLRRVAGLHDASATAAAAPGSVSGGPASYRAPPGELGQEQGDAPVKRLRSWPSELRQKLFALFGGG
jgi:hypothetical protein